MTAAKKLKIDEIRTLIRRAAWVRNDLTGGTSEEFRKQQVGPRLAEKIAELQALVIPARFADDIAHRAQEIEYCERVIARWNAAQTEAPVDNRNCMQGGVRHVFLGSFTCTLCGRPNLRAVN